MKKLNNFIILSGKLERLNLDPYFDKSRYQYCSVRKNYTKSKKKRKVLYVRKFISVIKHEPFANSNGCYVCRLCFKVNENLIKFTCSHTTKYILIYIHVICIHGPYPAMNSEDFDFWSSQSPLKAPPCADCSLVKPLLFSPQPAILSFHDPFCIFKPRVISPALPWQNFGQSPAHIHGYLLPCSGAGGVFRPTNDKCISKRQVVH